MISKSRINKMMGRFGVELHGKGYLQSLAKGEFKKDCFEVQQQFIKKLNPLIFDVGANVGDVSAKYLEYFPDSKIYAFEPFPDCFQSLSSRYSEQDNVHCIQKAVSSTDGSKTFFVNTNVDTNSLLRPQKTGLTSDEQVHNLTQIQVDSIVLDDFCIAENITHIDILKMDIQGEEYNALKGLGKMLSTASIDLIYSEIYFVQQYERQPLFHDISKLLFDYGYLLQDIYNPIYGNGSIAWADVIFTKIKKIQ